MSRVLVDKNLQYYVAVYVNSSASRRLQFWLQHTLYQGPLHCTIVMAGKCGILRDFKTILENTGKIVDL